MKAAAVVAEDGAVVDMVVVVVVAVVLEGRRRGTWVLGMGWERKCVVVGKVRLPLNVLSRVVWVCGVCTAALPECQRRGQTDDEQPLKERERGGPVEGRGGEGRGGDGMGWVKREKVAKMDVTSWEQAGAGGDRELGSSVFPCVVPLPLHCEAKRCEAQPSQRDPARPTPCPCPAPPAESVWQPLLALRSGPGREGPCSRAVR